MFHKIKFSIENNSGSLQTPTLPFSEQMIIKEKLDELQRQHNKQTWTQLTLEG
jgi:hypothetical protein